MGHAFPLAENVDAALTADGARARTRAEAERLAPEGALIASLETEWLTPSPNTVEDFLKRAESGVGEGFIQRYEDAEGAPVFAVTFWRLTAPAPKKTK
ncbi:MAG: hypothetical protein AAFQ67_05465, partial [Pseudomonadota bacterium]